MTTTNNLSNLLQQYYRRSSPGTVAASQRVPAAVPTLAETLDGPKRSVDEAQFSPEALQALQQAEGQSPDSDVAKTPAQLVQAARWSMLNAQQSLFGADGEGQTDTDTDAIMRGFTQTVDSQISRSIDGALRRAADHS